VTIRLNRTTGDHMETFKARLIGIAPLMLHNGQLADPTNKFTIALSKVVKGKAKDLVAAREIETLGSLYLDQDNRVVVPADMIYSCVVGGAKARKMGTAAKAGVYEAAPTYRLEYDGPQDPTVLAKDPNFIDFRGVRVGQNRVMRSRPIFRQWAVEISLLHDADLFARDDLKLAIERAGMAIGLGDYRPRFGRFSVEVVS
jgi:hypothetical protein